MHRMVVWNTYHTNSWGEDNVHSAKNRLVSRGYAAYICYMLPSIRYCVLFVFLVSSLNAAARYKHNHKARGIASYYSNKFEGRKTATGDVFHNSGFTAASNKFRLGAYVRVTNLSNGKKVYVQVNDRMGNGKRLIDLTNAAAEALDFKRAGTAKVRVKVVKERKGKRGVRRQG